MPKRLSNAEIGIYGGVAMTFYDDIIEPNLKNLKEVAKEK